MELVNANLLMLISWGVVIVAICLLPFTTVFAFLEEDYPSKQEYLNWKLGYDIQIVALWIGTVVFLNEFALIAITINLVMFYIPQLVWNRKEIKL